MREFWITEDDAQFAAPPDFVCQTFVNYNVHDKNPDLDEDWAKSKKTYHVIEKSAYDALEARCKKLEAALAGAVTLFQTNWKCDTCVQVNKDCYKLLVEALAQDEEAK